MKLAKSHKLIVMLCAFILSVVAALCLVDFSPAKADVLPSSYFTVSGDVVGALEFEKEEISTDVFEHSLTVTAKEGQVLSTKNNITFDDTELEIKLPADILKFRVSFNADTYDVNGYKDGDNYKKSVTNELILSSEDNGLTYKVTFNEVEDATNFVVAADRVIRIYFGVEDNFAKCQVRTGSNDNVTSAVLISDEAKYKIKDVDKVASSLTIRTDDITDGVTDDVKYKLFSIDTKASDVNEEYKQTFELKDDKSGFKTEAKPRVALNDSLFSDELKLIKGMEYTLTLKAYSVVKSNFSQSEFEIKANPENLIWVGGDSKIVKFNQTGSIGLNFNLKALDDDKETCETYTFTVIDSTADTNAPKYKPYDFDPSDDVVDAVKSFEETFLKSLFTEKDGKKVYVKLGSNEYLTLPSMRSLVCDDVNSYEDLSYTVYYKTPDSESTYSSALKIPLTVAGKYQFFVAFKDKAGNEMKKSDFITTDSDGKEVKTELGEKYIFSFEILDNSVMEVKAAKSQGDGFVGIAYTASDFDISATGYTTKYELYYSENEAATKNDWIKIPKVSEVTEDHDENGFTYDNIVAIAYDGALTFIPDRTGYYKIICTVSSSASSRAPAVAETSIISVLETPQEVKVDNHWFENNVWSVVFLSVGTLCLIGIIVLLCIKPKTEIEDEPKEKKKK